MPDGPAPTKSPETVILWSPTRWIAASVYLIIAIAGVVSVGVSGELATQIVTGVAAAVFLVLGARSLASRISVTKSEVIGRTERFTHRVNWNDIDRVELRSHVRRPWQRSLRVRRRDGDWVLLLYVGLDLKGRYETATAELQRMMTEKHEVSD